MKSGHVNIWDEMNFGADWCLPFHQGTWSHRLKHLSTVKAASKAMNSARNIQELNDKSVANGSGPIEPSNEMVKEAGDNMKNLLIKAVTIEVQSVIGDVCDEILESAHAPNLATKAKKAELKKRAEALKLLVKFIQRHLRHRQMNQIISFK